MNGKPVKGTGKYVLKRRRRVLWHRVVTAMASLVVFCTTYMMILPAITLTVDEGWVSVMAEPHVYINCPGEAQYDAGKFVGITPELEPDGGALSAEQGEEDLSQEIPMAGAPVILEPTPRPLPARQTVKAVSQPKAAAAAVQTVPEADPMPEQDPADLQPPAEAAPPDEAAPGTPENGEAVQPETPDVPDETGTGETEAPPDLTPPENGGEEPGGEEIIQDPAQTEDAEGGDETTQDPAGNEETGNGEVTDEEEPAEEEPAEEEPAEDEDLETEEPVPEAALPPEAGEEHQHTEACCDENGDLICGQSVEEPIPEPEPHFHTAECLNEDGELVCGLEGTHEHSDGCYDSEGQVICPFEPKAEEPAMVEVEIHLVRLVGTVRYELTGTVLLPEGMTQEDLLFDPEPAAVMMAEEGEGGEAVRPDFLLAYLDENEETVLLDTTALTLYSESMGQSVLPHTGGPGTLLWYTSGAALLFLAAACLMYKSRQRRDEV